MSDLETAILDIAALEGALKLERSRLRIATAEIERMRAGIREYACTRTDHPCGCYEQFLSEAAKIERLRAALKQIAEWARAYPLCAFPEPDFVKARALLEAGGITLDAVSASCMRHVVTEVGAIARCALEQKP